MDKVKTGSQIGMAGQSSEGFFFRRYVEAATCRSLYAANTGHPCAINHCHPRGPAREKVRESRAGRKLGREEKQKNEGRRRAGGSGSQAWVCFDSCTAVASSERCFIVGRTGLERIFASIDPIHRGHLSVRRKREMEKKKRDRNYVVQVDSRLTLYTRDLSSSLTYDRIYGPRWMSEIHGTKARDEILRLLT